MLRGFGYFERVTPEEHAKARDGSGAGRRAGAGSSRLLGHAVDGVLGRARASGSTSSLILSAARSRRRGVPSRPRRPTTSRITPWPWLCSSGRRSQAFRNAAERAIALNPMDGGTRGAMSVT